MVEKDAAMHVLVTGGAGYIGSVVTAELLDAGEQVTVLDDLSTGHRDAVPAGARFVEGSIAEAEVAFAGDPVDAVIHLAAKSVVAESVAAPQLYWSNNVSGSLALLEAMRRHQVSTIVFSSTAATYGEPDEVPIPESAHTQPTNPYGASKLAVDQMLTSYANAYSFAAVSLRYFNVAGARIKAGGRLGERHATETHLIPIALQVAAGERADLKVYGTDYPTQDGSCVRDYIHVVDLADAHLRSLAWARRNPGRHLICNLGSGEGSSVRQVADAVRRITGRPTPTIDAAPRPGDPAVLIASNHRAKVELDWQPSQTLEQMVTDAWTFAQSAAARHSREDPVE
jgi:UDP-glucose 4-epimerase